jgi:hypothetical protein
VIGSGFKGSGFWVQRFPSSLFELRPHKTPRQAGFKGSGFAVWAFKIVLVLVLEIERVTTASRTIQASCFFKSQIRNVKIRNPKSEIPNRKLLH